MTIPKHFCRVCGARATHQNLCDQPSCLRQARQVEVIKRDMSRLGWVATKEMVLEHCQTQLPILRLAGNLTPERERAISFLITEVKASLFDDVTTIVNNHPHAAKLMKLPLIKLPPPEKPVPRVFYMDTDSVVTDAPLGTPYEELVKAFPLRQRPMGVNANVCTTCGGSGQLMGHLLGNVRRCPECVLRVNSAYGKPEDSKPGVTFGQSSKPMGPLWEVNPKSGLVLRASPTPEGTMLLLMPYGAHVLGLKYANGWMKVSFQARNSTTTGYVLACHLRVPSGSRPCRHCALLRSVDQEGVCQTCREVQGDSK